MTDEQWVTVDDWVTAKDGRTGKVQAIRGSRQMTDPRRTVRVQFGADGPFEWKPEADLRPATAEAIDLKMGQTPRSVVVGTAFE